MNICFMGMEIVPSQKKAFVGGHVNNIVRLAKGLSENGHLISVITSDTNGVLLYPYSTSWGKIYPVHVNGEYASLRGGSEFILKGLHKLSYQRKELDVLHVHSAYAILGIIPNIFNIMTKIPCVFTLYSPITSNSFDGHDKNYRYFSNNAVAKRFLGRIEKIIAISENVKNSLIMLGLDDEKITIIPPAVDTQIFNPLLLKNEKRNELRIDEDVPVILYCGNWAKWKGVDVLIKSMVQVIDSFPTAKLILAWGEPHNWYDERKEFINRQIKALGLKSNIIEVGICKHIEELIASCDLFVAPFLTTAGVADYPLSILEAMACGKPVISTNVGGVPEIIKDGENGFLVQPNDSNHLAMTICNVLANKTNAERIGKKGAEQILAKHNLKIVTTQLEAFYSCLLSKNRQIHCS
ncbi:glycosyltransferase family 4 protein [Thermoproteota archaeon]